MLSRQPFESLSKESQQDELVQGETRTMTFGKREPLGIRLPMTVQWSDRSDVAPKTSGLITGDSSDLSRSYRFKRCLSSAQDMPGTNP